MHPLHTLTTNISHHLAQLPTLDVVTRLRKHLREVSALSSPRPSTTAMPVRVGVQGGEGSYNHAVFLQQGRSLLPQQDTNPAAFQLRYCYTTAGVLEALDAGSIDVGQFAISNSRGGAVAETMAVIGQHQFQVIEQYDAQIEHALMIHPSVTLDDITQIMTHPQVAMQCRETLQQRYPQLAITTGEGDLIDHAAVAAALHSGTIPPTTAVMGPETLADLYTLYIVDRRLNDDPTNTTSFVLVTK